MTSIFPRKKGSPFSKFFGNGEQALEEAYQAAIKIKVIEDNHFNQNRIPIEILGEGSNIHPSLEAEIVNNLEILQRKTKEFNDDGSAISQLSSNYVEKLIFVEGILAKYAMAPSSSAMTTSSPGAVNYNNPANQNANLPSIKVVDVNPVNKYSGKSNQIRKGKSNSVDLGSVFNNTGNLSSSLGKTLGKIKKDLGGNQSEQEIVDEFRRSKKITLIGVRLLILLIVVPIITQQLSKNFIIKPIVTDFRGEEVAGIEELNYEWKEEALGELGTYEEQLKMNQMLKAAPPLNREQLEEKVQEKANEIAEEFHFKKIDSISNIFADLVGFVAFCAVLLIRRNEINILKSFIDNIVSGLSDSAKAFAIILVTDIFVGFHSTHGWEVALEWLANHIGVAANESMISLFIATVPVIMDTVAKFWIFRYLSQISASTVATLKEMDD
ncbi:MAG: proton extrusion protein PcxA [Xenococcaceae cyanobacterium]